MTAPLYTRSEHVCRVCLGPILTGDDHFICAVCDATGQSVETICGCGLRAKGTSRDLGFRCVPNPVRSSKCPSLAIIVFAKATDHTN
jgi:hypothetical protein